MLSCSCSRNVWNNLRCVFMRFHICSYAKNAIRKSTIPIPVWYMNKSQTILVNKLYHFVYLDWKFIPVSRPHQIVPAFISEDRMWLNLHEICILENTKSKTRQMMANKSIQLSEKNYRRFFWQGRKWKSYKPVSMHYQRCCFSELSEMNYNFVCIQCRQTICHYLIMKHENIFCWWLNL